MKNISIFILAIILTIFGCTKSEIKDSFIAASDDCPVSRVVVLPTEPVHSKFANCLRDKLVEIPDLTMMPEKEFRKILFPWFEYKTAPTEIGKLSKLLSKKLVIERIKESGVEIVIFVHGDTIKDNDKGHMVAVASHANALGYFGYVSWDRKSYLGTSVYSLKDGAWLGESNVSSQGTSRMPAFVLPIPILVSTESVVCSKTAELIAKCLGRELPSLDDSKYR